MKRYRAVQVGLGNRGITHLRGMLSNAERFEVAGICDLLPDKVRQAANTYGFAADAQFGNAEEMVRQLLPDVLSFATLPHVRTELVELAARTGVKGLMFEKPMATSVGEAEYLTRLCREHGIKAVICHQHKYLESFQKLKGFLDSGELGTILKIDAETQAQLSQQGTHYMDYILWANQGIGAASAVGHVHGRDLLDDSHPSPDYLIGEAVMKNGVRINIQCGYFTRPKVEHQDDYEHKIFSMEYWTDARLTVHGTTGFAWAECNGRWSVFSARTAGQVISGKAAGFAAEQQDAQAAYTRDFAAWLDDDCCVHPSNISQAYHGMEILEAMCISALDHSRVDLPLQLPLQADVLARMAAELPDVRRCNLPNEIF